MKYPQIIQSIFILFLFTVLASCSSGNGGGSGQVSLLITDGPTADFDQINITLESIRFLGGDNDGKESIVFDEVKVINLLALQNYSDLLATTTIPAGSYSKIRLHVTQVELVKLNSDGSETSIFAKLPANGKIDLNPRGSFEIVDGSHLMIELDVDAEKSIHIVETGSDKYIFRPVIFINILGEEELKLVILDGRIFDKSESGFQLCKVPAVAVNDDCLEVVISENTVVQDALIDAVAAVSIVDNDIVTVLGKASSKSVNALHVVIAVDEAAVNNQALFTGTANFPVNIENVFGMITDDDNDVILPETALSVSIASGARLFDKFGSELGVASIVADISDVDVFGLAIPDLSAVTEVKAAFVLIDNEAEDVEYSGTIVAINAADLEITVSVEQPFIGDACVDISDAEIFLLESDSGGISSEEISINDLQAGMSVDVYAEDGEESGCISADVVLVTETEG